MAIHSGWGRRLRPRYTLLHPVGPIQSEPQVLHRHRVPAVHTTLHAQVLVVPARRPLRVWMPVEDHRAQILLAQDGGGVLAEPPAKRPLHLRPVAPPPPLQRIVRERHEVRVLRLEHVQLRVGVPLRRPEFGDE